METIKVTVSVEIFGGQGWVTIHKQGATGEMLEISESTTFTQDLKPQAYVWPMTGSAPTNGRVSITATREDRGQEKVLYKEDFTGKTFAGFLVIDLVPEKEGQESEKRS